jgi:hypothetical protein
MRAHVHLAVVDMGRHNRWGGRWGERAVYMFYVNLLTDLFQLFVYLAFFAIIFSYYGIFLSCVM